MRSLDSSTSASFNVGWQMTCGRNIEWWLYPVIFFWSCFLREILVKVFQEGLEVGSDKRLHRFNTQIIYPPWIPSAQETYQSCPFQLAVQRSTFLLNWQILSFSNMMLLSSPCNDMLSPSALSNMQDKYAILVNHSGWVRWSARWDPAVPAVHTGGGLLTAGPDALIPVRWTEWWTARFWVDVIVCRWPFLFLWQPPQIL